MTTCVCSYPFSDWLVSYLLLTAGFAAVVLALGSFVALIHIIRNNP